MMLTYTSDKNGYFVTPFQVSTPVGVKRLSIEFVPLETVNTIPPLEKYLTTK